MSTPLVQPSELATFLGVDETQMDDVRARLMLQLAQDLCESIATPLPDSAQGVVLAVAARTFANPEGNTAETVGPYTVQRGGSLYLTKADKATLRRLTGGTGAFSIDTLPPGVSAIELVTITGAPTGGTFALSLGGVSTAPIPYNASPAAVQAALGALANIGAANVAVTGTGPYAIAFQNDLAATPVALLLSNATLLTGGTTPGITVTMVRAGAFAAGANLPTWDRDHGYGYAVLDDSLMDGGWR